MTVSIIVPNASFTKFTRRVGFPYMEDTTGFFLYGNSEAESLVNRSSNASGIASSINGPTYSTGYAVISISKGFNTGHKNNSPYTHIAVIDFAGNPVNSSGGVIGHYNNGGGATDLIYLNGSGQVTNLCRDSNTAAVPQTPPASGFYMLGGSFDQATAKSFFHDGTTLRTASAAKVDTTQPTNNMRVGASGLGSTAGFKVAASVAFNRVLTDAQILEVRTYLKALLSTRSVTML